MSLTAGGGGAQGRAGQTALHKALLNKGFTETESTVGVNESALQVKRSEIKAQVSGLLLSAFIPKEPWRDLGIPLFGSVSGLPPPSLQRS